MKSNTLENCKIVIGAFFITFFLNGCARLSPILFLESLAYYNVNRNHASFPYVLCFIVRNLVGPLVGYLEQIFGMQRVILAGCVLSTFSIAGCFFSRNILTIIILWGVLFGTGFGLACQIIPIILNNQFPLDKSKANGFFLAGSALGAFVLPVVFQALLQKYGMSGSFLLLGAIAANVIPAGMLVNTFSNSKSHQNTQKLELSEKLNESNTAAYVIDLKKEEQVAGETFVTNANTLPEIEFEQKFKKVEQVTGETFETIANTLPEKEFENNFKKEEPVAGEAFETIANTLPEKEFEKNFKKEEQVAGETFETIANTLPEKDIKNNTTINNNLVTKDYAMFSNNFVSSSKTIVEINKERCLTKKVNFSLEAFKIFLNPVYIDILLINALSCWVLLCLWTIILDVIRDKGVKEEHEVYFIMCFPVAELISRLISGYIIDKLSWKCSTTLGLSLIGMAFSLIIFNFISSYASLFTMEIIMSFFLAAIITETLALIHEFIEEKERVMGMSCRTVLIAPSILTLSPMIGYFRGTFGSYDYLIYIMSAVSLLCAFITYILPYLSRCRNKK